MYCRGHKNRVQIVNKYNVEPIAHVKLLAGQNKESDAGEQLTDQYYQFKATEKNNLSHIESIQCGKDVANDFLKLINSPGLPLFNPLRQIGKQGGMVNNNNTNTNGKQNNIVWNPTARQLHNAIMWLIIIWNGIRPDSKLYKVKVHLERYRNYDPFDGYIKSVNNMIGNGNHGYTLTDSINLLKEKNNIRANVCDFTLLQKRLDNLHIDSNF